MADPETKLIPLPHRITISYCVFLGSVALFILANGSDRLPVWLDPLFLMLGILLLAVTGWMTISGRAHPLTDAVSRCRSAFARSAWSLAAHMALFYYVAQHKHQVVGSRFVLLGLVLLAATVLQFAAVGSWLRSSRAALPRAGERLLQGLCVAIGAGLALTAFLKGGVIIYLGSVLSFLVFVVKLLFKPFLPH